MLSRYQLVKIMYPLAEISVVRRLMPHDLLIKKFDDQIHSQSEELAKEKGIPINSIHDKLINNTS